jgi:hypothetical protein
VPETISRFPLQWPAGWKRTPAFAQKSARFAANTRDGQSSRRLSVIDGCGRVLAALSMLGVAEDDGVISTNVRTRLDGLPRSDQGEPVDKGAAVYWRTAGGKQAKCMAIDIYDRVADNIAAIAATLEAMRAIERHGGGAILDRVFEGFVALPAPEQWFTILGVSAQASSDEIEDAYRRLAMKHHPDRGGDGQEMARINAARDEGMEALR